MAYSKEQKEKIFTTVFERMTKGEALRNVLKEKDMPDPVTFYKWLELEEDKIKQYAHASQARADSIFEDMLTIADDQEHDKYKDEDGKEHTNHNVIQRSRLRVDTRKWYLSKLAPKKYGEKLELSGDPDRPVVPMTSEERDLRISILKKKLDKLK